MNSIELGVFAAVARAGSIGRAAELLHTVQSNVTQRVRALEDKLGVTLFHRSKRGVTLTAAGKRLLPYAARISEMLDEARLVTREEGEPRGELRIGAMETVAARRLPEILGAYAARYPEVEIEVDTGPTERLVERVLRRELDGAFVAGPVEHASLQATAVVEEELVLVTSPDVGGVEALRRDGRSRFKIIAFRAGCSYRQRTETFLAREGLVGLPRMEMGTLDGMIGCVAAGVGFAILPLAVVAEAASTKRVRVHRLPKAVSRTTTVFVQRTDTFVTAALRCFLLAATDTTGPGADAKIAVDLRQAPEGAEPRTPSSTSARGEVEGERPTAPSLDAGPC
jgi:LysR family transcriptional regulator, cell division regulator